MVFASILAKIYLKSSVSAAVARGPGEGFDVLVVLKDIFYQRFDDCLAVLGMESFARDNQDFGEALL